MKRAIDVVDAFENIRCAQRAGAYAPHRPLLILLALARAEWSRALCASVDARRWTRPQRAPKLSQSGRPMAKGQVLTHLGQAQRAEPGPAGRVRCTVGLPAGTLAVELMQKRRASVTVDGSVRETGRARLRVRVKTLRRYKYPPDQQEEAAEKVLGRAKACRPNGLPRRDD